MGEIINLRKARKAKSRGEAANAAAENRIRHGRTAAQRENDRLQAERDARKLDGAQTTDSKG